MSEFLATLLLMQLAALLGVGGIYWRLGKLTADVGDLRRRVSSLERKKANGLA